MNRTITRELLQDEYVGRGLSSKVIAARHGVAASAVLRALRRHGIDVRPANVGGRRYAPPMAGDFVDPASDWHAYWIGFLLAHGSYGATSDTRHTLRVSLRSEDSTHLHNLRDGLRTDAPVRPVTRKDGSTAALLIVCSRDLSDALGRWGIVPRKTGLLRFPPVADEWRTAVLRGYWDAHGTVSGVRGHMNCNVVSGSEEMLVDVQDILENHGVHCLGRWPLSESSHMLAISRRRANLERLCHVLYEPATVWLERTRARLRDLTYGDVAPSWMVQPLIRLDHAER